jgi:hypothetical protein
MLGAIVDIVEMKEKRKQMEMLVRLTSSACCLNATRPKRRGACGAYSSVVM